MVPTSVSSTSLEGAVLVACTLSTPRLRLRSDALMDGSGPRVRGHGIPAKPRRGSVPCSPVHPSAISNSRERFNTNTLLHRIAPHRGPVLGPAHASSSIPPYATQGPVGKYTPSTLYARPPHCMPLIRRPLPPPAVGLGRTVHAGERRARIPNKFYAGNVCGPWGKTPAWPRSHDTQNAAANMFPWPGSCATLTRASRPQRPASLWRRAGHESVRPRVCARARAGVRPSSRHPLHDPAEGYFGRERPTLVPAAHLTFSCRGNST